MKKKSTRKKVALSNNENETVGDVKSRDIKRNVSLVKKNVKIVSLKKDLVNNVIPTAISPEVMGRSPKDTGKFIYMADYHFRTSNQYKVKKNKNVLKFDTIIIKDAIVTIEKEMTKEQVDKVMYDEFYRTRILRHYLKSEGKVFNRQDALNKYIPVNIVFKKCLGPSFVN